jgi:hypothetical protein
MLLLRCTQRLLKASGISIVTDPPPSTLPLGEWYANRIPLPYRGRTAVIYTNSQTLLTVVVPGRALRTTLPAFLERMPALLQRLGLPAGWVEQHRVPTSEVAFATTANRRVLGSMNDLANQTWFETGAFGSWEAINWEQVEKQVATVPLSMLGYASPGIATNRLALDS